MFSLKLSRLTAGSLKPGLRKAYVLSLSPSVCKTHRRDTREFHTVTSRCVPVCACVYVSGFCICRRVMRVYLISDSLPRKLHTPVPKWFSVKGRTPVSSAYAPQDNLKSKVEKIISPQGSIRCYTYIPPHLWTNTCFRTLLETVRIVFLLLNDTLNMMQLPNCQVIQYTRANSAL